MNVEQYTDDAICFAMGLVRFLPDTNNDVLRLVCKPSFHPEVCITISAEEIVTVGLRSMLWREPIVARLPEFAERASVTGDEFEQLSNAFTAALQEAQHPPKRVIVVDGMTVSTVRIMSERVEHYDSHPVNDAYKQFVRSALRLAMQKACSVELRNRIAACGHYTGARNDPAFLVTPESPSQPTAATRLLVLGTPEDRADFHAVTGIRPQS